MIIDKLSYYPHTFYSNNNAIQNSCSKEISFKALSVTKAANESSLFFNEYLSKRSHLPILEYLKNTKMSPYSAYKFLCHATSDGRTSNAVAKELSSNPRKGKSIQQFLVEKLGGANKGLDSFLMWFHDEEAGYRKAYGDFYKDIFLKSVKNLNALVKQSPNVAPWTFERKATELGKEPVLGSVPADFIDIDTYRELIKALRQSDFYKIFTKTQNIKLKKNNSEPAIMEAKNTLLEHSKAFITNIRGKEYEIEPLVKRGAKLIYFITPLNDRSNKFILKMASYDLTEQTDKAYQFAKSQNLRADMPYLNALVDFYLKENKSQNAPDIKFFDYKTTSVLYGVTIGEAPKIPEKYADNLYKFLKYSKVSDLKKLGIEINDVHKDNFIVDKNGNYILIDSGHAKYSNLFRPVVIGHHITLGNLCGRELIM